MNKAQKVLDFVEKNEGKFISLGCSLGFVGGVMFILFFLAASVYCLFFANH